MAFPNLNELMSALHIRRNIVQDCGCVTLPGVSLTAALAKATQPEVSGALYAVSCYRATEYLLSCTRRKPVSYKVHPFPLKHSF